jgi:hypothetical protein
MLMLMPGQEEGNAAASILFGARNPSARLPLTFPSKRNEVNFTSKMWPVSSLQHALLQLLMIPGTVLRDCLLAHTG